MSEWSGGYVTDVGYVLSFHPEQAPGHLALTALINGVATGIITEPEGLSYLELGSGLGFASSLIAASNPSWRVTAIDFNPEHIATARAFAAEAGVANVTFLEADLATLAGSPEEALVPEADIVSLHGLWSWVSDEVRAGIVRLLARKVRAGGLVHVSYNALPAWQGALGLQRLVRDAGRRLAGRSDRQAAAGLNVVRALVAAGASNVGTDRFTKRLLERLTNAAPGYLAHEFMNASWAPAFHADVATALAGAKLSFVGSARLYENFPDLMLNEAQRAEAARFDDPLMFELIKDLSGGPALRQDLYVRGARRLSENERNEALSAVTLVLTAPPGRVAYEFDVPVGKATLKRESYGPVVEALAERPMTVAALSTLPGIAEGHPSAPELVAMLVGSGQAMLALRPEARPLPEMERFHAAAARRVRRFDRLDRPIALASHRLGGGLTGPGLELLVVSRLLTDGAAEPACWARLIAPGLDDAGAEALGKDIARILDDRTQIWRLVGVV
ncbi:MAG: class I SAM-dependent methyltransferase [Acetobacteraceae bacterium]